MSPRPSTLLGLVLCLGQTIHMQKGVLPKPSLRAEPGPVVPRGRPVTLVCQGPAGAEFFRLEKDGRTVSPDQKSVSQDGSQGTEARFLFPSVSEDTAGSYRCLYEKARNSWSEHSEPLELQVTEEDSTPPAGPASWDYTVENSIRLGLAAVFLILVMLLILVAILVEAGHSQPRSPQEPQEKTPGSPPRERGPQGLAGISPRVRGSRWSPGDPEPPPLLFEDKRTQAHVG